MNQALRQAANETLALLERGEYETPSGASVEIASLQRSAIEGTRLYAPSELERLVVARSGEGSRPPCSVTDETTQEAGFRISSAGADIALLNFASARNAGGGFLGGASAQEEDLCRCSGLYPTLLTQPGYYEANRKQRSLLYTDHLIYSPRVPFFRTSARDALLEEPFVASVLTSPAPNAGPMLEHAPEDLAEIPRTFTRRWAAVLAVAADQEHRHLVLGAWGCGAFGNDPRVASRTALEALSAPGLRGAFDQVVFAIPEGREGNHVAFQRALGP